MLAQHTSERTAHRQATWRNLVQGLRAGDHHSGRQFWDQYGPALQRLANKHVSPWLRRRVEPDDVVQSACRTFFRHLQGGEYELADGEDLMALLCAITMNKVLMKTRFHFAQRRDLRKEKAPAPAETGATGPAFDAVAPEPSPADATEFAEEFQQFLAGLNEEESRIVDLELQGCSQREIAEKLGRTDRWVRKVLERVRSRLRGALEECPT